MTYTGNNFLREAIHLTVHLTLNPSLDIGEQIGVRDRLIRRVNTGLAAHILAWSPEYVELTPGPGPSEATYHLPLVLYPLSDTWRDDIDSLNAGDWPGHVAVQQHTLYADSYQTRALHAHVQVRQDYNALVARDLDAQEQELHDD